MLARQCREPLCDCRSQRDRIFRGHLHLHEVATRDEGEVRGRLDAEGLERRHPSYQAKSTQDVVHVFQLLRHGGALVVHECELVCDRVCGSGARVRSQEEEEEEGKEEGRRHSQDGHKGRRCEGQALALPRGNVL